MLADQAIKQSVQTAEVNRDKIAPEINGSDLFWGFIQQSELLPVWGQRVRDLHLRRFYYAVHNSLVQGTVSGIVKRIQTVPWEIKGKKLVSYYQDLIAATWETLIAQTIQDYLTQDFGAVWEIIGGGNPNKPLTTRVTGIAHMDSLSCATTRNQEYPIIYHNEEDNSMHRMHRSRVVRFIDMPSAKRTAYLTGLCALSRYISEANVDILLGRHDNEMLNDLPPSGILAVSGMLKDQWNAAQAAYERDRMSDNQGVFRGTMIVHSPDPDNEIKLNALTFSALPENFDAEKFNRLHVNKLALAFGIDPQDIWPLSGQALGTGTQSTVLHSKAQGKLFGSVLQMLTRAINYHVLPDSLEFQFKFKDTEEDREEAERAKFWVDTASAATFLTDDERRKLVANQVEAFKDILLDEKGELIALPDDDPKDSDQETTAEDFTPLDTDAQPDPNATQEAPQIADSNAPVMGKSVGGRADLRGNGASAKNIQSTQADWAADFKDLLEAARGSDVNRRRAGTVLRALISRYGKQAYTDGLVAGGVEDGMSDEDLATVNSLITEQSAYVTGLMDNVFSENGVSDEAAAGKALMWWNKSISPMYSAGLMSADQNGMYRFDGSDGDESCPECTRLKSQVHRFKEWEKRGFNPLGDSSNLGCKGYRCQHTLKKVNGKARGGW